MENCYSTGRIRTYAGGSRTGGLCGFGDGTAVNCFWDTQTSGYSTSIGGTGRTSAQMTTSSTYSTVGWNFSDLWTMSASYGGYSGYPIFSWQEDLVGFDYWAISLPENQRKISDCPAGDDIPNLLKYASGLSPQTQCSDEDIYTISFDLPEFITVRYFTSKEAHGVRASPVFKENLSVSNTKST